MRISDWSSDVCSSDLLGLFPAVAGAATVDSRQQQLPGIVRFGRGMAAFAFLGPVRGMVEPAIHHIAHRLMHRQHLPTCIAVRAGRRDGVAVVAGAALRKDGPDSVVGAGGARGRRAEIGMLYPALRI